MAESRIIVLVSGEIASGKTTLATRLEGKFGFKTLKTREAIKELAKKKLKGNEADRTFLQKFGTALDEKENGRWVLDHFQSVFNFFRDSELFVIDSVRVLSQILHFRKAFSFSVYHIHLTASEGCLKERFLKREEVKYLSKDKAEAKYLQAKKDETEQQVHTLSDEADLNIDTELCTEEDVLVRVASFLKLLPPTINGLVDVIVGGQFGSEGKGQIAAHISPQYDCLMRVGSPNDRHTVYEEPFRHVFHMLPSGCHRNQFAKLVLGPGSVINIDNLFEEISKYKVIDEFSNRLIIDENAIVVSKKDIQQEAEFKKSTAEDSEGVEFATANNLLARLTGNDSHKAKNHSMLKPFIGSSYEVLETMYKENKRVLLEGSNGSGNSLYHGSYPNVISKDTSTSGCLSEAGISPKRVNKIIMVARTYPSIDAVSSYASGRIVSEETLRVRLQKNKDVASSNIKGDFTLKLTERISEFSWALFRKACDLNSPTDIALTFTDFLSIENRKARRYDQLSTKTRQFIGELEMCSGVKVSMISTNFDYRAIIDRRNWK